MARKETFDWRGAILMCVSMVSFFLAVVKALDWGLTSGTTLGLVGISALTGLWLAILELRVKHPVFDPSLLKIRLFSLPVVSSAILFAGLFTIVFLMPFYLVNPLGLPIDKAGYTMVIPFVCLFFISPLSGALSDRIGSRWLCTAGNDDPGDGPLFHVRAARIGRLLANRLAPGSRGNGSGHVSAAQQQHRHERASA